MNATNRGINRILLLIVGLVLLGAGVLLVTVVAWPAAGETWQRVAGQVDTWFVDTATATPIGASATSWLTIGALAVLVLVIVLLVVVLARLGGGRTRSVLPASSHDDDLGRIVVKDAFAADALMHSLTARADVLSARVTAGQVREDTVLHVSVTPHRNTSPRVIALEVDRLASNLAALTGDDLPTYVSIRTGLRVRLAAEHRDLA